MSLNIDCSKELFCLMETEIEEKLVAIFVVMGYC